MRPITAKQIKLLQLLAHHQVLASWSHQDLIDLRLMGFASSSVCHAASGKLAQQTLWAITEKGREWLQRERGGQ